MGTSIEWLIEQLQAPCRTIPSHIIEQAKEMHYKELMDSMQKGMELQEKENNRIGFRERNGLLGLPKQEISDEEALKLAKNMNKQPMTFVPNEISDEEIEKAAFDYVENSEEDKWTATLTFIAGVKWYREQLKQRR